MRKLLLTCLLTCYLILAITGYKNTNENNLIAPYPAITEYIQNTHSPNQIQDSIPTISEDPEEPTYLDELVFPPPNLGDLSYTGNPYTIINDNIPYFTEAEKTCLDPFENFSDLDDFGRCGACYANVCEELMPTEKREEIGMVRPSGWHTIRYDHVDGKYLYNRCHLIGFQLSGENANTKNLITGTRYLNVQGMLPFENMVADYVHDTDNHVLYRATPIFNESDLVAKGVLMEAYSVEDDGQGIQFNVFCFNVQPGVRLDYATGDSWADETIQEANREDVTINTTEQHDGECIPYILNTRSKKVHLPTCSSVMEISAHNREEILIYDVQSELFDAGYSPCKNCHPF